MCPEELALAKTRLPDNAVDLFELKAQNLSAINRRCTLPLGFDFNEPNYSSLK